MSLHNAAKHLESKGRNGDTMLVHMTPGEVRGLQALALAKGGSLSINPDTGLVEANFLKKMLPTIAGIGLSMIPGVGPLMAAGMVGGFETMRTGDLGKGLMAGLGAYGGAGIGQGLATAGQAAQGLELGSSAVGAEPTMGSIASKMTPENADFFAKAYETGAAPANTIAGRASQMSSGLGSLGTEGGRSLAYQALPKYTLPAAGMSVANAVTPKAPGVPGPAEPDEYDRRLASYRLSPNFSGYVPPQPNPYYRPTGLGYAEGGEIMMAAGGTYDDEPQGDMPSMAMGGIAGYAPGGEIRHLPRSASIPDVGIYRDTDVDTARKDALEAAMIRNKKLASGANMPKNFLAKPQKMSVKGLGDVEEIAGGGSIGGYSDGGRMLKGPGDGMSDSIPATIGKRQPARLADGEFVVPADVVSHLGNGSTDAGAKRLYGMMDKVRKARTGKKSQAKAIKADKYMPA
jgi:hypothetical protein